jgi:hypothetical protein
LPKQQQELIDQAGDDNDHEHDDNDHDHDDHDEDDHVDGVRSRL